MGDLTLTLPPAAWLAVIALPYAFGIILQHGGIRYGRGQHWETQTLFAALLFCGHALWIGLSLAVQNGAQQ